MQDGDYINIICTVYIICICAYGVDKSYCRVNPIPDMISQSPFLYMISQSSFLDIISQSPFPDMISQSSF